MMYVDTRIDQLQGNGNVSSQPGLATSSLCTFGSTHQCGSRHGGLFSGTLHHRVCKMMCPNDVGTRIDQLLLLW